MVRQGCANRIQHHEIPDSMRVYRANNNYVGHECFRRLRGAKAWLSEFQTDVILQQGAVSKPWPQISQV